MNDHPRAILCGLSARPAVPAPGRNRSEPDRVLLKGRTIKASICMQRPKGSLQIDKPVCKRYNNSAYFVRSICVQKCKSVNAEPFAQDQANDSNEVATMKEFFGFGGYDRTPEGYFSWQHIVFVSSLMVVMLALAVVLGRRSRGKDLKAKLRVLKAAAVAIDVLELFKIVLLCFRSHDAMNWLYNLPLFLCSIQLITIPLAAFSKGRVQESALDFVFIFGVLGAVLGTYGAGQNYSCYPVLSFDNVVSGLTHSISGFCSIYIAVSGLASMKRRNILITFSIISFFTYTSKLKSQIKVNS